MVSNEFMQQAVDLARSGVLADNGGPFGAVIVQNGQVVGKGNNGVTSTNDPTAHAEITAIRHACQTLGRFELSGCEIYSNCEPCPMCLCAIMWARLDSVYYAANRADAAEIGFDDQYFYDQIALPIEQRDLKMIQVERDRALTAFEAWTAKKDKIPY